MMKLYLRKYFDSGSKVQHDGEKPIPVNKNDVGHLINQVIIWGVIVFLSLAIIKKFF
jgi:hypothetical protein